MFLAIGLLRERRYFTGAAAGMKAQAFMWSSEAAVNFGNIELGCFVS
jgi:hypothetical protein